ncbi:response regulator [Blautia schinkii]|nr:response regulator [Blautia schinkii]
MKVFVVDDEYLQRELIKKAVDWDTLGMVVAGEAEDGEEALRAALEIKPDIMIMDINIPYVNGLEVSRRVKAVLPDTQIIILTAYGEFQYAREALAFGAVSFVVKPVNPRELTEELQKCRGKLEKIQIQEKSIRRMKEEIGQKQKEQFLLEQISGIVPPVTDREMWEGMGLFYDRPIAVIYVKIPEREATDLREEEVEEMVQDYFPCFEKLTIHRDSVFLIFGEKDMELQLQFLYTYLQEEMNKRGDFCGGVSLVHSGAKGLREAYQEAYAAGKKGQKLGKLCLYEPLSMSEFLQKVGYEPEKLMYLLRKRDYGTFRLTIEDYFSKMDEENILLPGAYYVAMDILVHFSLYLTELGIDFSGKTKDGQRKLTRQGDNGNVQEMAEILLGLVAIGQDMIENRRLPATKKKVEDAKAFIDKNYHRFDMSLNLTAEAVGVNPSYLSNIFKKECGCSLSRYLTNVRLEQGKRWMEKNPGMTLADIAEKIGYGDVYYFSKTFKSHYGITPSKYQEEIGN